MTNLVFNLYALVGKKLKYFFPFAAHYHLTCHKNNINAIMINAAYQLKNVEAGLKVVFLCSAAPCASNIEL